MNYVAQANRPNPAALMGALGIPTAVGALLIAGLAVTVVIPPPVANPTGTNVEIDIEPLPDPEPPKQVEQTNQTRSTEITQYLPPRVDPVFNLSEFAGETTTELTDFGEVELGPIDFGIPDPTPVTLPDPIAATPRGDPSRWITDNDYRTRWVREEMTGRAGFALSITAEGRVSDCVITRSSGHAALDQATCRLLERRARFSPAQDSSGNPVAGTYDSSVNWQIPD